MTSRIVTPALAAIALSSAALDAQERATVIANASVIDGTGAPARRADVRIVNGRITAVGPNVRMAGDSLYDARGLTLSPGFIDSHSHHDRGLSDERTALAAVSQGITTIVAGQDGGSPFPLARFFARLDTQPAAVNVAAFAGHGTLRGRVLGDDFRREATTSEVARMVNLLREELAAGALGLSTGLEYDPGIYSSREEVIALARTAAQAGGIYISHIRSEDRDFWQAIDEIIEIGRAAAIPVQISHAKLAMRGLWGQAPRLIALLDSARRAGIRVTADVYPYTMWQSTLTVLYPRRNFADRAETDFILREVAAPDDLVIGYFELDTTYHGKSVAEIARIRRSDPATTLMALIAESESKGAGESVVAKGMDERDIETLMRWPHSSISSDGALRGAHPRGFGAFPRVLSRYVRERGVLSLPEAVRRMTSLPAATLGLPGIGRIAAGSAADLVLFDPAAINDHATIAAPHAVSTGIRAVWVNGVQVFANGLPSGRFPGSVLRRSTALASSKLASAAPSSASAPLDSVDRYIRAEMQRQRIPGLAVGIVHRGRTTARGYGYANLEHMVPVTDATIFQSGSLGKMFTSAAIMLLVEDGKLALTDPISKFFPEAPASWRGITVQHLLTHTSGIPDYTTSSFDYRRDYTEDELARMAYALRLEFPAGSRWNYSNTGYALLGFIVRRATGTFYGDVLRERVFRPLGMTTARVITEADIVPNRAAGYRIDNDSLRNQEWVAPQLNTTADGSLYLSLRDLLAWNDAVRRRAVLKPGSWNQVLTQVRLASGRTYPYGMGWGVSQRDGSALHEHGGAWQGFKTHLSRFIGEELDIIVLANLDAADPGAIAEGIAAIINPRLAPKKPEPMAETDPRTEARARELLGMARDGKLSPSDFAYVRAGFFPDAANFYRDRLRALGEARTMTLLHSRELGDDRISVYRLTFASGETAYLHLGLAPDGRVSAFRLVRNAP